MALALRVSVVIKKCDISFQLSRILVTSNRHASKARPAKMWKKMTREERYMKKLCEGLNQPKRKWTGKDAYLQKLSFIASDDRSRITVSPGMVRRANQLSAVIHENIFYSFCYEDICPDLLRYNLEISKVKVTPDLNNLNVYWTATGNKETDEEIEQLLKASRGKLRSALTKKRIMNRMPPIQFIKDIKTSYAKHVDDLLERADMGTDHFHGDAASQLKSPQMVDLATYKSRTSSPEAAFQRLNQKFQNAEYTLRDGPGAKLVVMGGADFGASSSLYCDRERIPKDVGPAGDPAADQNVDEASSYSTQDGGLNLKLRNDIYDLDHSILLMQVLHMKKRLMERGHVPETETSRRKSLLPLKSRQLDSDSLDSKRIHKLLKESMRKSKPKLCHLNDVPLREDWQKEQLKLRSDERDEDVSQEDDEYDSDGVLDEFDYRNKH